MSPVRSSLFYGLLLTSTLLFSATTVNADSETTIIENVTVIDAVQGSRPAMRVVIEDDRITSVSPAQGNPPESTQLVDGEGKYLIPGLWDMHVHLAYDAEVSPTMPALFLGNGVTYVRDTGGVAEQVLGWKKWAQSRADSAPRVFVAGPLLDGAPTVYDGAAPGYPLLAETITTVEQAEARVDELAAAGVDLIKVYEMLQPEVFLAIIERAHEHGLPVTGHVPLLMTAEEVSQAGLNSIEHLRNVELSCSTEKDSMLEERRVMMSEAGDTPGRTLRGQAHSAHRFKSTDYLDWERCTAVLDLHRGNLTRHIPTVALVASVFRAFHTEEEWRKTFEYLPDDLKNRWLVQSDKMSTLFAGDPEGEASREAYLQWIDRVLAYLADDSMLMAGTDTPIFFLTPGFSLHKELEQFAKAGLTPMQALESATLTPARYFGLENEMGSIAPGKNADLVLLNADPLEDIRNTTSINSVMRAGRLYDREALDVMLNSAASGLGGDF
jgi:imidazolonepropionase-like amidohydrolase